MMSIFERRIASFVAGAVIGLGGLIGLRPTLTHLNAVRDRGALLAAIGRHTPPPPVPLLTDRDVLKARDREHGCDALRLLLRDEAIRQGVLIERLTPLAGDGPVAMLDVVLSGPSAAVLRFASTIESQVPLVRLVRWRVFRAATGGGVRLDAVAVSPWERG